MEKATRVEEKNEADACEKCVDEQTVPLVYFVAAKDKNTRRNKTRSDTERRMEFAKANAVKSTAKDSLDLVLVTSDLEWIHERRVRDAIANEWVYSALSLSSALISISKLWAKTLRV